MKAAYKKRSEDFKMRVLEYNQADVKSLQTKEQRWLDMISDKELSISQNVMEGCNRYYNMKKNAFGGSVKGHTKKKHSKPSWRKGLPPEMVEARRDGLFCVPCDKPKTKKSSKPKKPKIIRKPTDNKFGRIAKPKIKKNCIICETDYYVPGHRENSKCCSLSCAAKLSPSKENGRNGIEQQRKTIVGRKREYRDDGSWFWNNQKKTPVDSVSKFNGQNSFPCVRSLIR